MRALFRPAGLHRRAEERPEGRNEASVQRRTGGCGMNDASTVLLAGALALFGLALAAAIGRMARRSWVPGLSGAVTGGCGIGAVQLSGYGDIGLLPLAGVLAVYGALVGAVALLAGGGHE